MWRDKLSVFVNNTETQGQKKIFLNTLKKEKEKIFKTPKRNILLNYKDI